MLLRSCQQYTKEVLHARNFFTSNSVQACVTPSLYQAYMTLSRPYLLFIKNRIKLQYKVTFLVLKLLSETYIFSVVLVINCS